MLKNYGVDTTYLKGYAPEIERYKWSDQSNFESLINKAEIEVSNFFGNSYRLRSLRPELLLRDNGNITATTTEDGVEENLNINRLRFVIETASASGSNVIKLQGSNDDATYYDIPLYTNAGASVASLTVTEIGTSTATFKDLYKYYRVSCTIGTSINYKAFLVETCYDDLYAYKMLYLIFADNGENFIERRDEFAKMYSEKAGDMKFYYDYNDDGELADNEKMKVGIVSVLG